MGQPFFAEWTRYSGPLAGLPADAGIAGDASYKSLKDVKDDEEEEAPSPEEEGAAGAALLLPLPLPLAFSEEPPLPACEEEGTSESITDRSFWRAASNIVTFFFFDGKK